MNFPRIIPPGMRLVNPTETFRFLRKSLRETGLAVPHSVQYPGRLTRGRRLSGLDSRALKIVEQCLDLDEAGRDAFIAAQCAGSPDLAARVRSILAMEAGADGLLPTQLVAPRPGLAETLPDRIGKFRVIEPLGRGGMGMVVRAERDDGVYRQSVAIKLIRADLRDARDRDRFANERRLLARLSHPSIARILDGGEQDDRPYLVMELVEGRTVTDDLAQRKAGLAERLAVFGHIAEAVSHAHRNLVIHGDIKPANIIRTPDGGIKLLDFGIGRLTEELETAGGVYPLTPAYAAPERRQGEPPSVAADVYSLGVLLHEMVTGALPGAEPVRPGDQAGAVPARLLRGDVEAIVGKATAQDPADRYPDVASLQADLQRHREFRPIAARPPYAGYVARRFLRRNRLPVAIGAAFALLVSTAAIVSTVLYFDAQRQRAAAETRFNELRSLAKFQLFELYDRLAETPGTTAARADLAAEAQQYLDRLSAVPGAPADLRFDVARGLNRLASVQGVPRVPNLGRPELARRNLARAAAILDGLAAEAVLEPGISVERARNRILRAQIAVWLDFRTDIARRLLGEAQLSGTSPAVQEIETLRRSAWLDVLGWEERYAELQAAAQANLDWLDRWAGQRPMHWYLARADALNSRGDARYYLGDRDGALTDYRAADLILTEAAARWPRRATILARQAQAGYNIASTRADAADMRGMVPFSLDLVRRGEALLELEANDVSLRRRQLVNRELAAQILAQAGRRDEAVAQQRRVVEERAALAGRRGREPQAVRDLAFSRSVLGTLEWQRGRRDAACAAWAGARSGFERLAGANQLNAFDRERNLAYVRFNLDICRGARPASAFRAPT